MSADTTAVLVAERNISKSPKKRIKTSLGERIFYIANYTFLTILGLAALYPFIITFSTSFSSNRAVLAGEVIVWPVEFSLEAYKRIIEWGRVTLAMGNSIYMTVIGTILNMIVTIMCAYPLSKKSFPGKYFFVVMLTITMFFGGGLIPTFILIKQLHLMDSFQALWLLSLFSTYNMIILRTFFSGIPAELEESAKMDGANDLVVLVKIFLPLSKAVLATLTLFYAVGWWNSYMGPLLYISSPGKVTLMVMLRQLLDQNTLQENVTAEIGLIKVLVAPESFKAASIIISTVPILLFYPFLQKHFVKGVMVGSIKG